MFLHLCTVFSKHTHILQVDINKSQIDVMISLMSLMIIYTIYIYILLCLQLYIYTIYNIQNMVCHDIYQDAMGAPCGKITSWAAGHRLRRGRRSFDVGALRHGAGGRGWRDWCYVYIYIQLYTYIRRYIYIYM